MMRSTDYLNFLTLVISIVAVLTSTQAVRLGRDANQLPIIVDLLQQYREVKFIKREEWLWSKLQDHEATGGFRDLPEPAKEYATEVSQYYQAIAYLTEHRIADFRIVAPQVRWRALQTWNVIKPFVEGERRIRGGRHTFLNTLEYFVHDLSVLDPKKIDIETQRRSHTRRWRRYF